MHEGRVTHDFNFPQDAVFSGISHHVEFLGTSNILCRMIRLGDVDPNGLGALREVRKGSILFEEAITVFLAAQASAGPSETLSSALAAAHHALAFQTLADQVRRTVRSTRGNAWMFRLGHPLDQPLVLGAFRTRRPQCARIERPVSQVVEHPEQHEDQQNTQVPVSPEAVAFGLSRQTKPVWTNSSHVEPLRAAFLPKK